MFIKKVRHICIPREKRAARVELFCYICSASVCMARLFYVKIRHVWRRVFKSWAELSNNISREHHTLLQPAVYQVTRQGHEHCDDSEGTLLDITPLDEHGAKIFTLYEKDLTEGVNLLIGD